MRNHPRRHVSLDAARRPVRMTLAVAALAVALAACGSSKPTVTTLAPIPAPRGLPSFFSVPQPLPHSAAGTLLKSERLSVTGLHGVAYRVMYLSESVTNKPVTVTGLIVVPDRAAPTGGYPVVTWGHGTNGMADQCTPSLDPTSDVPLANDLLDQGWEITSSDYQGEGTPGILPYLVGVSRRATPSTSSAPRNTWPPPTPATTTWCGAIPKEGRRRCSRSTSRPAMPRSCT